MRYKARQRKPPVWGYVPPKPPPKSPKPKRSEEELDKLAEEFRSWRLQGYHISIIMFGDDLDFYTRMYNSGIELSKMSISDIKKRKDFKSYIDG